MSLYIVYYLQQKLLQLLKEMKVISIFRHENMSEIILKWKRKQSEHV